MKRPLPFQFFLAASAAVLLTFPSGCSDDPQFFFGPTRDGGELTDAGSEVGPRLDGGRDVDSDSGVDGGPAGDSGESDSATADIGPEDGGIEGVALPPANSTHPMITHGRVVLSERERGAARQGARHQGSEGATSTSKRGLTLARHRDSGSVRLHKHLL